MIAADASKSAHARNVHRQTENLMAELRFIVPVDALPDKIYAAVATQAGMRSWWTADTRMEEKVGGKAEFGFDELSRRSAGVERHHPAVGHRQRRSRRRRDLAFCAQRLEGGYRLLRKLQRNVGKPNVPPQGQRRRKRARAAVEGVAHSMIFRRSSHDSAPRFTAGSPS